MTASFSVTLHSSLGVICSILLAVTAGCAPFPRRPAAPDPDLPPDIVLPAREELDRRPVELIWYPRDEEFEPLFTFDSLIGWRVEAESGARVRLNRSREQQLWGSHVGHITYVSPETPRGAFLGPSEPVSIDDYFDSITVWIKGPGGEPGSGTTGAARFGVAIQDASGRRFDLCMAEIDWAGWWLVHRKLTPEELEEIHFPCRFVGFELAGLQSDREISLFIDSPAFFVEPKGPLSFETRPRRNLSLRPGQSHGANTGTNHLSFPVTDRTVMPPAPEQPVAVSVTRAEDESIWFVGDDGEGSFSYRFIPAFGPAGLELYREDVLIARPLSGAEVISETPPGDLMVQRWVDDVLHLEYDGGLHYRIGLEGRSLVVDVAARGGWAKGWSPGVPSADGRVRAIEIPYLDAPARVYMISPFPADTGDEGNRAESFGRHDKVISNNAPTSSRVTPSAVEGSPKSSRSRTSHDKPEITADSDGETLFLSIVIDWYRSNASRYEPGAYGSPGSMMYDPNTDGRRNDLYERVILTAASSLDTVLPTVPNPPGDYAASFSHTVWYLPPVIKTYAEEKAWIDRAVRMGMTNVLYGTTKHIWRDDTESISLRTRAAPRKGGTEALADFLASIKAAGMRAALYVNYYDISPLNRHWTMEAVQRLPGDQWRNARPAHYALKPLLAAEWAEPHAAQLKAIFGPEAVFLDVHGRLPPWNGVDYDARVPGAGTFTQTFFSYGELMRNLSRRIEGPVVAHDRYAWLYAGLADLLVGDEDGVSIVETPWLPIFKLNHLQALSVHGGAGLFKVEDDASAALDRYLAAQIVHGNAGRLLWFGDRPDLSARSYYMMQALQTRYLMRAPNRMSYWSGERFMNSSDAIREGVLDRSQIYVRYPGDLEIWVNGSPAESWEVRVGRDTWRVPPSGWIASGPDFLELSVEVDGVRMDYVESPDYLYFDGRGSDTPFRGVASPTPVVVRFLEEDETRIEILDLSQTGLFGLAPRAADAVGLPVCVMWDAEGRNIGEAVVEEKNGLHWFDGHTNAVRYVVTYGGEE